MTKLRNIEFLRIFFAVAIVYYHIFHANIIGFCKPIADVGFQDTIQKLIVNSDRAGLLVEGFVIIAGFFLFHSIKNKGENSIARFAVDKLVRLYAVYAFSALCCVILDSCGVINLNFYTQFLSLITLQSIGVNIDFRGINWFISPFFWSMIFIYAMYKTFDKKVFHFALAVLIYFCYVILVQNGFKRETIGLAINLGVVRMIASLGLGYFIGMFHNKVKDAKIFENHKILTFILFSAAEIATFASIVNWTLFYKISYNNSFIFIPVFAILIFSFAMNKGLLSKITNIKLFEYLGKYSYSIYVMQQISFWLLGLTLWRQTNFLQNHFALTITLSLLFSTLIGAIVYYIVEKPVTSWYKNLKLKDSKISGGG